MISSASVPAKFLCKNTVLLILIMFLAQIGGAQNYTQIDPRPFEDNSNHWYFIFEKSNLVNPMPGSPRFKATEITKIADNIMLFQKDNGGWPKNYDVFAILTDLQKDSVRKGRAVLNTTYDNGSTYTHIAAMAQVYTVTKVEKYKTAALKGLDFILSSQYKNGGWPQQFPLEPGYSRNITFNDGVFVGIMKLLKDIKYGKPEYKFLDNTLLEKLIAAFDRSIPCILKTQINDNGVPTAWCQQYDEVTLQPAWARKFEPPGICNSESADLLLFLMNIEHPSKEIIQSVQHAVNWFEVSKIYNTRIKTIPAERLVTEFRISNTDRIVVKDSTAPPIWTRYYELKTHKPMFCNRDSKVVYSLAEVLRERRDGYSWYTYSPQMVLNKYPAWKKKMGLSGAVALNLVTNVKH